MASNIIGRVEYFIFQPGVQLRISAAWEGRWGGGGGGVGGVGSVLSSG